MLIVVYFYYRAWDSRKKKLDDNMEEMLFNRDAELAESWMAAREAVLENEDSESTDVLMKKQKDFEKAIAIQVNHVFYHIASVLNKKGVIDISNRDRSKDFLKKESVNHPNIPNNHHP